MDAIAPSNLVRGSSLVVGVLVAAILATSCGGDSQSDESTTSSSVPESVSTTSTLVEAPTTETAPPAVQAQPEDASSYFSIEEVVLGPEGFVRLENATDVPVTLAGLFLCQASGCAELPDEVVAPLGSAYIAVGDGPDAEDVVVGNAPIGVNNVPILRLTLWIL